MPISSADRELVFRELDAILASYHFRGSKRYPAFLKYVVEAALDGRSGDLKERTIGVEVFNRDCGYDTSADPVVRFSAAEVRKRIAQYYQENGNAYRLRIEIPLGSYAPEFIPKAQSLPETAPQPEEEIQTPPSPPPPGKAPTSHHALSLAVAALLLVAGAAVLLFARPGSISARKVAPPKPTVIDGFWAPVTKAPATILIVIGSSLSTKLAPESSKSAFIDHMMGPYHNISVAT
ncbi:MAG TPA: hypothetical protein VGU23_02200, partial [Acidobacteriaceae bacterium]|nr:hypothetical protein [Acidobacteriaceae bacterium]